MADPESTTAPALGGGGAPAADEPRAARGDALEPGARCGDYVVEARRGSGGFATVYRARDERTGAIVALKVLHACLARTPSILRRFQTEAATIARLDHPGIVRLLGYGERAGVPYLAMEWVDGATLAELLRDRGPLMLDEALAIVEPLGDALAVAHGVGVVHRDLKAANIAIAEHHVKLLDFGIAKLLDPDAPAGLTTAGTKLGTPHYMAPEQVLGRAIDHRTDIYALGILVFEMVTARRPFDGGNLAEIEERQLFEPPPAASQLAGVPAAVDDAIRRAMAKDPAHRHASVGELIDELRAAAGAAAATPAVPRPPARRTAVGLYVHAIPRGEDVSDEALDQLDRALAEVRTGARALGLAVATETASSVLFVGVPPPGESTDALVERAATLARSVIADASHPELVVALTVHVADAELAGDRCAGGALLEVASWAHTDRTGVFLRR